MHQKLNEVNLDKSQAFPQKWSEKLLDVMKADETPLIAVSTDLSPEGRYEVQWAVVTDKRLYVLSGSGDDVGIDAYALGDINEVAVRDYYGAGAIEIKTGDGTKEILRYTRRYRKKLQKFEQYFRRVLDGEELDIKKLLDGAGHENLQGEDRCPNCGTPFRRGTSSCPNCSSKTETLRRLLTYLRPYKLKVALMLLTTLIFTVLNLVPPYLQKIMIDNVMTVGGSGPRYDLLALIVLAILAVHVFSSVFMGLRSYQLSWLGQKIIYDLRSQVYKHLQTLGLAYFDRRQTGAIMNRVTGDTASIQQFIVNGIQETIVQIFTLVIIAIILFTQDWQLALIVLLPTPFIFYGTKYFSYRIHKVYHRIWRRRSNLSAVLGGAIPGIKVVKAFTQEYHETQKFDEALDDYFNEEVRAIKYRSVFFPLISMATSIGAVLIWGYGGYRVIGPAGDLSLGTLTAFIGYMWRFYQPIQSLSHLSEQFESATTAAERVFEILDHKPELDRLEKVGAEEDLKGEIEFKNVSFYYNVGEEVLKNINFRIRAGEMIGLVGSSGAGKSTLVNLIPRFYEVTDGEIFIDNRNIKDMDLNALRSHIGVVLQEPYLFYGSIAENIAYGRPSATMEEIIWAAKAANAHKFIMNFPDGFDTIIGERGIGLSGGEKQRISIARAILKNPKILILDEATSSVDTETEKLIQEAIDRLIKNRTTIAIAHRLSTLKNADRIIVLENGEIVEEGTHDELMSKEDGFFRRLVEIQAEIAKAKVV
ncbi:MAG TPA: ABC transporter transmembrane domain-containing protein [Candidatus Atribacteria bacterium]|nr:ABC transporter transmembrane domain-containing protein [Candidatus Atribacteria bacterium]